MQDLCVPEMEIAKSGRRRANAPPTVEQCADGAGGALLDGKSAAGAQYMVLQRPSNDMPCLCPVVISGRNALRAVWPLQGNNTLPLRYSLILGRIQRQESFWDVVGEAVVWRGEIRQVIWELDSNDCWSMGSV